MKTDSSIDIHQLVSKLKNEDQKYSNLSRRMQVMYMVLIPVYLFLIIVHIIDGSSGFEILSSICFLLGMVSFAVLFHNYHKEYKLVDYSQPTVLMLKKAVNRYQPITKRTIWTIPGILFIGAGLSLKTSLGETIIIQVIFWVSMVLAIFIGLLWWKKRYKPIRDSALAMLRELEN